MNSNLKKIHADYINRINRVMDYIEVHLDQNLTLEQLADIACFSKFHFHRIFQSITGECLAACIQRIRLEKAASLLSSSLSSSITEIALNCGFTSSASFTNAFKRNFGKSPTQYKNDKQTTPEPHYIHYLQENIDTLDIRIKQDKNKLSYCIKGNDYERHTDVFDLPAWDVAYIRYTGPYKGDSQLFSKLWKKLNSWAAPQGLISGSGNIYLALYHDNPEITVEEKLRVSVCMVINENIETAGEVGKLRLPGGKYAVSHFLLGEKDYARAWGWVYGTWLPSSGFQADDRIAFEWFPPHQKLQKTAKIPVDICIPVKKL